MAAPEVVQIINQGFYPLVVQTLDPVLNATVAPGGVTQVSIAPGYYVSLAGSADLDAAPFEYWFRPVTTQTGITKSTVGDNIVMFTLGTQAFGAQFYYAEVIAAPNATFYLFIDSAGSGLPTIQVGEYTDTVKISNLTPYPCTVGGYTVLPGGETFVDGMHSAIVLSFPNGLDIPMGPGAAPYIGDPDAPPHMTVTRFSALVLALSTTPVTNAFFKPIAVAGLTVAPGQTRFTPQTATYTITFPLASASADAGTRTSRKSRKPRKVRGTSGPQASAPSPPREGLAAAGFLVPAGVPLVQGGSSGAQATQAPQTSSTRRAYELPMRPADARAPRRLVPFVAARYPLGDGGNASATPAELTLETLIDVAMIMPAPFTNATITITPIASITAPVVGPPARAGGPASGPASSDTGGLVMSTGPAAPTDNPSFWFQNASNFPLYFAAFAREKWCEYIFLAPPCSESGWRHMLFPSDSNAILVGPGSTSTQTLVPFSRRTGGVYTTSTMSYTIAVSTVPFTINDLAGNDADDLPYYILPNQPYVPLYTDASKSSTTVLPTCVAIDRNINDPWATVTNTNATLVDAGGTQHPGGYLSVTNVLPDNSPYTCLFVATAYAVTGGKKYVPWGRGPYMKFESIYDSVLVHTQPGDNPDPTAVGYSKFVLSGDTLFEGMQSNGSVSARTIGFNECITVTPSSTTTNDQTTSVEAAVARAAVCSVQLPTVPYTIASFVDNVCAGTYFNQCQPGQPLCVTDESLPLYDGKTQCCMGTFTTDADLGTQCFAACSVADPTTDPALATSCGKVTDQYCTNAAVTAPECACYFRDSELVKINVLGENLSFNDFQNVLQANFGLNGIEAGSSMECWWPPCQKGNTKVLRPSNLVTCPQDIDVCIALIENANAASGGTLYANCTLQCPPTGTNAANHDATQPITDAQGNTVGCKRLEKCNVVQRCVEASTVADAPE